MTRNENQWICGGTFFTLLLQARKPRMEVREHHKGTSDGLSDTDTLIALIKIVVPDYMKPTPSIKGTFKGNTSDFKSCKISRSAYLPFALFNELNRTHWAIKRVNLIEELQAVGISLLAPT